MSENVSVILFVADERLSLKQLEYLKSFNASCNFTFYIVITNNSKNDIFSSYGKVYKSHDTESLIQCNMQIHAIIRDTLCDFIVEIDEMFFIDIEYIRQVSCMFKENPDTNIISSDNMITYDGLRVMINKYKHYERHHCKCYTKEHSVKFILDNQQVFTGSPSIYYIGPHDFNCYRSVISSEEQIEYTKELLMPKISEYKPNNASNLFRSKKILIYDCVSNSDLGNKEIYQMLEEKLDNTYTFIIRSELINELDLLKTYQSCFMGIQLFPDDINDTASFCQTMGKMGLPVITNSNSPNAVSCTLNIDEIIRKINFICNNYQQYKTVIFDSVNSFINNETPKSTCTIMNQLSQPKETKLNLNMLLNENNNFTHHIILLCNNSHDESMFAIDNKYVHHLVEPNIYELIAFSKIFYPYDITIQYATAFLSANYPSKVRKILDEGKDYFINAQNYTGDKDCNKLFIRCTLFEADHVKTFKYTLLNKLNWQIKTFENYHHDPNYQTQLYSYRNISNSCLMIDTYTIVPPCELYKLVYAETDEELKHVLTIKPPNGNSKKYAFVSFFDSKIKDTTIFKDSYYMAEALKDYCDVLDIRELSSLEYAYEYLFIDCISFINHIITLEQFNEYLDPIRYIPKILIFDFVPDSSYDEFNEFMKKHNIKHIISKYDCNQYDNFVNRYKNNDRKFYLTNQYNTSTFKPISIPKKYDILIYGFDTQQSMANKLRLLLPLYFNVKIINQKVGSKEMLSDAQVCNLINESWICITDLINTDCLTNKFFEIAACGSVPCGKMNNQGKTMFQYGVIELTDFMSEYEILRIMTYYLNNKQILKNMSEYNLKKSNKYTYDIFHEHIDTLYESIIDDAVDRLDYNVQKNYYAEDHGYRVIHLLNDDISGNVFAKFNYNRIPHLEHKMDNICIGSFEHGLEVERIVSIFGMQTFNDEFIVKKRMLHKPCETLILLGLYTPNELQIEYDHLFNQFSKIIIVFTHMDILHYKENKLVLNFPFISKHLNKIEFCATDIYIQNGMKDKYSIDTSVFYLPLSPMIQTDIFNLDDLEKENNVACHMDIHFNKEHYNKIVKIAKNMPDYTFNIYTMYKNENKVPKLPSNVNLLLETELNLQSFLIENTCSLKISDIPYEPMSCIESMILDIPTLFNHDLQYAIKTESDINDLAQQIKSITPYTKTETLEIQEYYLKRNSCKNFIKNLAFFMKHLSEPNDLMKLRRNNELRVTLKLNKEKRYCAYVNGNVQNYSSIPVKICLEGAKEVDPTYCEIETHESYSHIDFVPKTNNVTIIISSFIENVNINEFCLSEIIIQ